MYDKKKIICIVFIFLSLIIILDKILKKININIEKYKNSSGTNSSGTYSSGPNWLSDIEIEQLAEDCNWSCGRTRTDASTNGKAECYPDKNGEFNTYQECIKTGCESHINDCVLNSATEWVPTCYSAQNEENCDNSYYFENSMNETNINVNSQRCRWLANDNDPENGVCVESNNGTDILYNKCNLPKCEKYYRKLDNSSNTSCFIDSNINEDDSEKCGEINGIKFSGINSYNYLVNCNSDYIGHENLNLSEQELINKTLNNNNNICYNDESISDDDINKHMCDPIDCEVGLKIIEDCSEITADICENHGEKFSIGSTQVSVYNKQRLFDDDNVLTEWDTMENSYIIPCRLAENNDTLLQCIGGSISDKNDLIPICKIPDKCKNKDCGQNGIGMIDNESSEGVNRIQRGYCDNNTGECICDSSSGYSGENCEIFLGKPESKCIPEGGVCAVYDDEGFRAGRWWDATNGWGCCKSGDIGPDNWNPGQTAVYGRNVTYNYEAYERGMMGTDTINRPGRQFKSEAFWEAVYFDEDKPPCISGDTCGEYNISTCSHVDKIKSLAFISKTCDIINDTPIIAIPSETYTSLDDGNDIEKGKLCPESTLNLEDENCWDKYEEWASYDRNKSEFVGWGDKYGLDRKINENLVVPRESLFCQFDGIRPGLKNAPPNHQVRICSKCSDMQVKDTAYASIATGENNQQKMLNWSISECSKNYPRETASNWIDPGLGRSAYDSYNLCVGGGDTTSRCGVTPGGSGRSLGTVNVGACQAAKGVGENSNLGINVSEQGAIKTYDKGCPSR